MDFYIFGMVLEEKNCLTGDLHVNINEVILEEENPVSKLKYDSTVLCLFGCKTVFPLSRITTNY